MPESSAGSKRLAAMRESVVGRSWQVGGEFSIFDGSVTGTNLELQEAKLIVQRWRFGSWNDGVQSTVSVLLAFVLIVRKIDDFKFLT